MDKALLDLDKAHGDVDALEPGARIGFRHFVPDQASALRLDELVMLTGSGLVLGADHPGVDRDARAGAGGELQSEGPRRRDGDAEAVEGRGRPFAGRERPVAGGALRSVEQRRDDRARRVAANGKSLARVGDAYAVTLSVAKEGQPEPKGGTEYTVRTLNIGEVEGLKVVASVSREKLKQALTKLDSSILFTGAATFGLALFIAVLLARSLSRPIVALARETREVVSGEPRTVRGRGGQSPSWRGRLIRRSAS